MSKRWRRAGGLGTSGAAGLTIVSVTCDGSENAVVTFSAPVVWSGLNQSDMVIDGDAGNWVAQGGVTDMAWMSASVSAHNPGEPWSDLGPEAEITPGLSGPQSGLTV